MRTTRSPLLFAFLFLVTAASSFAQEGTSSPTIAPRGVVIAAGGVSAAPSGTSGGVVGVTATVNLTARLGLEGNGVFGMSHMSSDTQSVTGSLLFNLLPARKGQRIVPYVAGGGGIYRSSFDMDGLGFGSFMSQYSGYIGMMSLPSGGFGMMQGTGGTYAAGNPVYTTVDIPMFYATRMGMITPVNGRFGTQSFTDPAVSYGFGVQFRVRNHFIVRPDVRAITAFSNGERRTVANVTVGLGYGF